MVVVEIKQAVCKAEDFIDKENEFVEILDKNSEITKMEHKIMKSLIRIQEEVGQFDNSKTPSTMKELLQEKLAKLVIDLNTVDKIYLWLIWYDKANRREHQESMWGKHDSQCQDQRAKPRFGAEIWKHTYGGQNCQE